MIELRQTLRRLGRSPIFTISAVLTVAVGIGATASAFALLHATLFRALPFPSPDRLVAVHLTRGAPGEGVQRLRWSHPEFEALRGSSHGIQALAAFGAEGFNVSDGERSARVSGEIVSPDYFRVLGVEARLGRTFRPAEGGEPGAHPVAVISHELWESRFGGEPMGIGRTLRLNGVPLTVIGVLPEGFQGLSGPADVWITHATAARVTYPEQLTTHQHFLNVVGRLADGADVQQAQAALAGLNLILEDRFSGEHEAGSRWGTAVQSLDAATTHPDTRRERFALFAAVLLVLFIAGADLAALLLGRALSRRREFGVRRALGSTRARLVGQLVSESTVLALAGGVVGIILAVWITGVMASFVPPGFTGSGYARISQFALVSMDGWVVAFALGCSLAVGLLFGLGPALVATREGSADPPGRRWLRGAGAPNGGGGFERGFCFLVVAQFGLALTLLVGAGLLLQTLTNLEDRDAGFQKDELVTFRVSPPSVRYGPEDGPALLDRILQRVRAVPGVQAASVAPCTPFMSCPARALRVGNGAGADDEWLTVRRHYVAPGHLRTLGVELLRGRDILDSDGAAGPNVAVVNRTMARELWPDQDPIGRRVVFQGAELNFVNGDSAATVVGVAEDLPYGGIAEPTGYDVYTPYPQFAWPSTYVVVRSDGPARASLIPSLRQAVSELDPDLPIHDIRTPEEVRAEAVARPRANGLLLAGFAALAVLLASLGIYGTMSQYVGRRTRELGLRLALGADPRQMLAFVARKGLGLALSGIALGTLGALAGGRVLASQLYGVGAGDLRVLVAAVICLTVVAMLAVGLPAIRAARVDPAVTLREEG